MTQIPLSDAIQQLRDQLREAILEGKDQDIVFTPNSIDIWSDFQGRGKGRRRLQASGILGSLGRSDSGPREPAQDQHIAVCGGQEWAADQGAVRHSPERPAAARGR